MIYRDIVTMSATFIFGFFGGRSETLSWIGGLLLDGFLVGGGEHAIVVLSIAFIRAYSRFNS